MQEENKFLKRKIEEMEEDLTRSRETLAATEEERSSFAAQLHTVLQEREYFEGKVTELMDQTEAFNRQMALVGEENDCLKQQIAALNVSRTEISRERRREGRHATEQIQQLGTAVDETRRQYFHALVLIVKLQEMSRGAVVTAFAEDLYAEAMEKHIDSKDWVSWLSKKFYSQ